MDHTKKSGNTLETLPTNTQCWTVVQEVNEKRHAFENKKNSKKKSTRGEGFGTDTGERVLGLVQTTARANPDFRDPVFKNRIFMLSFLFFFRLHTTKFHVTERQALLCAPRRIDFASEYSNITAQFSSCAENSNFFLFFSFVFFCESQLVC